MKSFHRSAMMMRESLQPEALAALKAMLGAFDMANEIRLNRSLTLVPKILARANYFIARMRGFLPSECMSQDKVAAANDDFSKLFKGYSPQWIEEILNDPEDYLTRIREYESDGGNRPDIPFDTEKDHYRLIVGDPLRIQEEHFVYKSIFKNGFLGENHFSAVDLGTGSGRLAFCMADVLQRCVGSSKYEIYGLDINPVNIKDALESKGGRYGSEVKFVTGDMSGTPFESDRFSFCNSASALYLVPAYARPLCLLEMVRILAPGGSGIITGPNENFSVLDYAYCMGASNFMTYINPANMYLAQKLGPTGMLIEAASRQRRDFGFPDTSHMCLALEKAGCEIVNVEYWPKSNVAPIYSAVHFRKTEKSAERMVRYNAHVQKLNKSRGVKPI